MRYLGYLFRKPLEDILYPIFFAPFCRFWYPILLCSSHRLADIGIPCCCVRYTALQILVSHIVVFVTSSGRYWYPMLLCSIHRLANFGIPSHATVFVTPFGRYWYPMLLYVSRYLGDFVTPRFWVGFALLCSIWKIIVCLLFFHCLVCLLIYCFWYHLVSSSFSCVRFEGLWNPILFTYLMCEILIWKT